MNIRFIILLLDILIKKFGMSWVCKCYSNYRNDLLLVKIAVNVVISIQWIVDYVAGVATFNLIARILGAVFMPLPLQRPAFLSLISMFIYLLIKLGAVIALVKVIIFFFNEKKLFYLNQWTAYTFWKIHVSMKLNLIHHHAPRA